MWIPSTKAFNTHWKNKESQNLALKAEQCQILKAKDMRALGTSLLIIQELHVLGGSVLVLTKRHVGSGNEIAPKCQLDHLCKIQHVLEGPGKSAICFCIVEHFHSDSEYL